MVSPNVLELERLIEPISAESSVGVDLREDSSPTSPYYLVKDARSTARAAERQALMNGEDDTPADWRPILEQAPTVLAEHAKDLEIVAYLIEALARQHGFPGLRDGFRLARELVTRYGDEIYPLPDEDGVETRVAPLTGLNGEGAEGTLIGPINSIPLTDNTSVGAFGQSDYQTAIELERAPEDARQRRIEQGACDMMSFQTAVAETSAEYFGMLLEDIKSCIEEFALLDAALEEKYGHDAPPTTHIRTALRDCQETLELIAKDKLATLSVGEEEAAEEGADETAGASGTGAAVQVKSDVIENREDAFRQILKIAEFFRRTEPHTPISYALERIVRWGRLPLPDLLQELIHDDSSVAQMFRLVGIENKDEMQM